MTNALLLQLGGRQARPRERLRVPRPKPLPDPDRPVRQPSSHDELVAAFRGHARVNTPPVE